MFTLTSMTCGNIDNLVFDSMIPTLTHTLYNLIRIGVPLLLIFFGMLDLGKAVMAQKEDEIKKGQSTFVKRLVAAVIVFLVFFIVELVIGLVAPRSETGNQNIFNCVECFIDGPDSAHCEAAQ